MPNFKKFIPLVLKSLDRISPEIAGEAALRIFTAPRRIPRPEWERRLIESAGGKALVFAGRLAAISFGSKAAPAVILIHGWEGRGTQLGVLVEPLVAQGFRVIALDISAHGESPGRRVNIGAFASDLSRAVEELRAESGKIAAIVAHSFGAGATVIALHRGLKVERAVLVAAPSSLARVAESFAKGVELSARSSEAFFRRLGVWTGIPLAQTDLAELAESLSTPALIVHDPEDKWVPFAHAERFVGHWPGARLLALRNVGHHKILKSPLFISAVAEFLAGA